MSVTFTVISVLEKRNGVFIEKQTPECVEKQMKKQYKIEKPNQKYQQKHKKINKK